MNYHDNSGNKRDGGDHHGCPTCGYHHFTREEKIGMLRIAVIFIGLGAAMCLMLGWIIWGGGLD